MPVDLPIPMAHARTGKTTPVTGKTAAGNRATEGYPKEPPAGARVTPRQAPERGKAPVPPPPPKNGRVETVWMLPTLKTDLTSVPFLPYPISVKHDHDVLQRLCPDAVDQRHFGGIWQLTALHPSHKLHLPRCEIL